jgi:hypothetical protein
MNSLEVLVADQHEDDYHVRGNVNEHGDDGAMISGETKLCFPSPVFSSLLGQRSGIYVHITDTSGTAIVLFDGLLSHQ